MYDLENALFSKAEMHAPCIDLWSELATRAVSQTASCQLERGARKRARSIKIFKFFIMNDANFMKWKQFLLFVCVSYCSLSAVLSIEFSSVKSWSLLIKSENRKVVKKEPLPVTTTMPPDIRPHHHYHKPLTADDSLTVPKIATNKFKIEGGSRAKKVSKPSAFHHFISGGDRKKGQNEPKRTSVLGVIFLSVIMVVVASTLFIMLVCFVHKWRENMAANTSYPKVEYSMLRQGEDEPEDPLGEILINIGLAAPEDIRPLSETESDDADCSKIASFEPQISTFLSDPLHVGKFTTISLENDEAVHLLPKNNCDESDEEMLQ